LAGLNPLTVPIKLLTRHGASEYGPRLLSEGRFLGLVPAALPPVPPEKHRPVDPEASIPSKSEDPVAFLAPMIQAVVNKLKETSPAKQENRISGCAIWMSLLNHMELCSIMRTLRTRFFVKSALAGKEEGILANHL